MDLRPHAKAFVPLGVAIVLALVSKLGLTPTMSVQDAVGLLLTSGLVWLTPNKQQS